MTQALSLRLHHVQSTFRRQSFSVRLWIYAILLGLYSCLAVYKEDHADLKDIADIPYGLPTLLGAALSLLLVFRTNTAYDRWWEGRKLWGQLLNDSRSLIVKVRQLVKTSMEDKRSFAHLVSSFAHSLKEHLRQPVELQTIAGYEKASARPRHLPAYFISQLYASIQRWREEDRIDGFTELMLDRHAAAFSDVAGGCERIRNTPLSHSYRVYLRLCLGVYLLTLPWGLVENLQLWTIPAVIIISFFMLGLEMVAETIEEPFGTHLDDLPLDDLCRNNEINLLDILYQPDL